MTYQLPHDHKEFMTQSGSNDTTYIVKPENDCQGKGIFLTRDPLKHAKEPKGGMENTIVQKYITNPYLIDGLKFDLRLYVLLNGISPMRCYLYQDGLARFATVPYKKPTRKNLKNLFMHLTNYAINKHSLDFEYNESAERDDVGHKRSLQAVLKRLKQTHTAEEVERMLHQINSLIVKTISIA